MTSKWEVAHGAQPPSDESSFTITAPPETDIWRRSDTDDIMNAPMIYKKLPSSTFKKFEITVFAPWQTQYDQGGLVIAFPSSSSSGGATKWIKAGIEYFSNQSVLSVVGTDRYSDWSMAPMHTEYHQKARFRAERDGETLWIYAAQDGSDKLLPMREVKWAFMEGRLESEVSDEIGCGSRIY